MEQLDLLGGQPVPAGPPRVPSVTFYLRPFRRDCSGERIPCGHCQMNAFRFRRSEPVEGWRTRDDVVILKAKITITRCDGSTLSLCAQHAQEHEEREDRDG